MASKTVPKQPVPSTNPSPQVESATDSSCSEPFCRPGQIIDDRFRVTKLLKAGGFGQVYEGIDMMNGDTPVAVKLESSRYPSPLMDTESAVLQKMQGTRHAPVLCGAGRLGGQYNYIAMQLLGPNLSRLRRKCPMKVKRFFLPTILRLGTQCLTAIKDLHTIGYVHRDIKGANFAIGPGGLIARTVFLLDYGLVRLHLDESGRPVPERAKTGFRGTARYASVAVHQGRDAGRKDDLWSMLYMIVEWFKGHLPWPNDLTRTAVYRYKLSTTIAALCRGLPQEMFIMAEHISSLKYPDKPDYVLIDSQFRRMATNESISFDGPLDWEENWQASQAPMDSQQSDS